MPKSVTIRDGDDDLYSALAKRAAELGVSVPALLRKVAARLAARQAMDEKLAALAGEQHR